MGPRRWTKKINDQKNKWSESDAGTDQHLHSRWRRITVI